MSFNWVEQSVLEELFDSLMCEVVRDGKVDMNRFEIVQPWLDAIATVRDRARSPEHFRSFLAENHAGPPDEVFPGDTLEKVSTDQVGSFGGIRPTVPRYEVVHSDDETFNVECDDGDMSWSGSRPAKDSITA